MLSLSSSNCFSQPAMICSRCSFVSAANEKRSIAFSSRSNSLTLYQRRLSAGTTSLIRDAISERACSTRWSNVCCGVVFTPDRAILTAQSASAFKPSPLTADVSIISQPSCSESFFVSMRSPFFLTISIMFNAISTGMPISVSCVVRYRLRSMLDASTRLTTTSGRSSMM